MLAILIMAGGSGERFWPLSTKEKPKQLLKIFNEKSLIRLTYERILPLVERNNIFIATNHIQMRALKQELPEIDDSRIIIEPSFRDTAAAIAYGSMMIAKYCDNPTICVLASDHLISDEEEFRKVIKIAEVEAKNNTIVTLGIRPSYPETGYGYIEIDNLELNIPTRALGFREKPQKDIAEKYFEDGHYLWNSGIFIFNYTTIMEAFEKYSPNHFETITLISSKIKLNEGIFTSNSVKEAFEFFEKKSIDFAVMEMAENIMVIPASFGWNDVGSFKSLEELFATDENNNIVRNTLCISVDSSDNIVISDGSYQRVSLLGIHGQVVVITMAEILICSKNNLQQIRKILNLCK